MLVSFLLGGRQAWRAVWATAYAKLFVAFVIYVLISAWFATAEFGNAKSQFELAADYIRLAMFFIAGWVIYRHRPSLAAVVPLVILSMVIGTLRSPWLDQLLGSGSGDAIAPRFGFRDIDWIQTGAYLGVLSMLLLLVAMNDRLWGPGSRWKPIGAILVLPFALAGILLTQSRGAWLGFALGFTVLVAMKLFAALRLEDRAGRNRAILAVGLAVVAITVFVASNQHRVVKRLTAESSVYQELAAGEIGEIGTSSAGARIHMNRIGLKLLSERPLFGYGPYVRHLIEASYLVTELHYPNYGHLHNSYLEFLLRFGAFGAALLIAGLAWLGVGLIRCARSPGCGADYDWLVFYASSMGVLMVWSLIDYRFTHWENTPFYWIYLGFAYSRVLALAMPVSESDSSASPTGYEATPAHRDA